MTVTTSSTTGGTFKLAITGTVSNLTHTGSVYLLVLAPNFSISANPSATSVVQGATATYTVTFKSVNGFNSSVSLSAAGRPAGSTRSFSPRSVSVPKVVRRPRLSP